MKMIKVATAVAGAIAFVTFVSVQAQSKAPIVYPAKGQSADQQKKDDGECYTWAKSNTGIDPAAVAAAPPPPPPGPTGDRVKGAARGAIVGGAIDGSDGARTGAAVGVVAGGAKSRQKQAAAAQSADSQKAGAIDTFNRAKAACLEGRGYTIK
jgi:hypothetical protein